MKKGIDIYYEKDLRIVKGLGYYQNTAINDLRELVKGSAAKFGDKIGFKFKDGNGNITGKTYREFDRDIDCLGTALHSLDLAGAHISVISENRYEWGVSYFSVINGTGIAVPLDKYLPINEVENLVERGKVEVIFYSPAFSGMMAEIADKNTKIKYFICMENLKNEESDERFTSLPLLIEKGKILLAKGDRSFVDAHLDNTEMTVILFTSGTTSMSKGVMLSHANLASNVTAIASVIKIYPTDVHLSLLPLHHTFENTAGLMFMVYSGVCIAYCEGIKHIVQNMKEYDVSILIAVPAIFEAMYKRLQEGIKKSGKEKAFKLLTKISGTLLTIGIDARRKLFKSVFNQLGPKLRLAVSGAAPLDVEVIRGFGKIGFQMLQGYGLTETSPVVSATNDFVNVPGTIGNPIAGVEVAIEAPDESGIGEIIVRGNNVMLGYYEDAAATLESINSEGWFKTGDLGIIDERGLIKITGRAKSMIVLSNGKKAFPEEYEVMLNNIEGVKESFVWGNKAADGDIQICAELVIDRQSLAESIVELSEKDLALKLDAAVREMNKQIPQYKIIRYFVMTDIELAKTTKLSIKRSVEFEKVQSALAEAGLDMRKASGRLLETLVPRS